MSEGQVEKPVPDVREIQRIIYRNCREVNHTLVCPNRHVPGWYEADVLSITRSMFWHEYEVKVSRSDFLSEFRSKKLKHAHLCRMFENGAPPLKVEWSSEHHAWAIDGDVEHGLDRSEVRKLRDGYRNSRQCPNYFWFVTVDGIAKPEEIPDYAGHAVIETVDVDDNPSDPAWRHFRKIMKPAPRLHKEKLTEKMALACMQSMAYRFWQYF